jgi:hypothetical protein
MLRSKHEETGRSLMGKVWWSDQAAAELDSIDPAVRDQLRQSVEEILHVISPRTADPAEEGAEGEIMWHRGDGHGRFTRRPKGPQDYFLLYKRRDTASGSEDPEFEVLAVCSIHHVARMWVQMTSPPAETGDR